MEEAPALTPKPIENIKKEFKALIDGQNYIILLGKTENNDYIILEIKGNLNKYSTQFNQKEISSIIKEFKFIFDINEIYDLLSDIISNQRYKIHENIGNLTFTIKICKINGKEEEYNLILNPIPVTKEGLMEKINDLKNRVITLENLVNQQNNIITEQNNTIKNFESKFNIQSQTLIKYNERITALEKIFNSNKIVNKINYFENNDIINSEEDIEFLINRLEFNGKIKHFDLIYSVTKNGSGVDIFHNKCDNINNTLTIIKTTKNIIFGGFTKAKWDSNSRGVKDSNAFCFSLNKKKIYNVIENKEAIYCKNNYGPCFKSAGDWIIFLSGNLLTTQQHTCTKSESHYDGLNADYELNNEERNFYVKELEVYKIQFQ